MDELNLNNDTQPAENLPTKRPLQLTVMCILSFIGGGMMILSNFVYAAFYDMINTMLLNNEIPKSFANVKESLELTMAAGRAFFVTGLLINMASLTGVILMWNQVKKGFHVYTIAQILIIMSMFYFIKGQGFPTGELLLSSVFVSFYALNLKAMK